MDSALGQRYLCYRWSGRRGSSGDGEYRSGTRNLTSDDAPFLGGCRGHLDWDLSLRHEIWGEDSEVTWEHGDLSVTRPLHDRGGRGPGRDESVLLVGSLPVRGRGRLLPRENVVSFGVRVGSVATEVGHPGSCVEVRKVTSLGPPSRAGVCVSESQAHLPTGTFIEVHNRLIFLLWGTFFMFDVFSFSSNTGGFWKGIAKDVGDTSGRVLFRPHARTPVHVDTKPGPCRTAQRHEEGDLFGADVTSRAPGHGIERGGSGRLPVNIVQTKKPATLFVGSTETRT